jgi:hypothetical protein
MKRKRKNENPLTHMKTPFLKKSSVHSIYYENSLVLNNNPKNIFKTNL